jgi:excinuclease UvrABC nuclease subunit
MLDKAITVEFDGYWRDENKSGLPAESGVYCVYECTHNVNENTVSIHMLLYIGESDNVNRRVTNHEKYQDWLKHVRNGNELCFSYGSAGTSDRARTEAALILKHKPPVNDEYVDSFPYDTTTISLSGKTALLNTHFTVNRT